MTDATALSLFDSPMAPVVLWTSKVEGNLWTVSCLAVKFRMYSSYWCNMKCWEVAVTGRGFSFRKEGNYSAHLPLLCQFLGRKEKLECLPSFVSHCAPPSPSVHFRKSLQQVGMKPPPPAPLLLPLLRLRNTVVGGLEM